MKNIGFHERGAVVKVDFGQVETRTRVEKDYNELINKPSIEGIILEGDITLPEIGVRSIQYHTEAEWNAQPTLLTAEGALYIYSDHTKVIDPQTGEVTIIPALKIGDGVSYLSQLPFIGGGVSPEVEEEIEELEQTVNDHITDGPLHVSDGDRDEWNSKVKARVDEENPETLVLF